MQLEFLGAAGTVTGSMHLLTTDGGRRILLDCGLYQGRRAEAFEINSVLPFDPSDLDAIVLSHAHIDHSGNLPSIVRGVAGGRFAGRIHATHATRDLCTIMLGDSAGIQESDAAYLARKGKKVVGPLYTTQDALATLQLFSAESYHAPFRVTDDVQCTFVDAGHILGSAMVMLDVTENGATRRLCFTGDIGRPGRPLLRDPEPIGDVDFLITESTYGGKAHPPFPDLMEQLRLVIHETVLRGGKVIIPAFAVGRTQDLVYLLNVLFEEGRLPRIPIYVDSPLAVNATDIFRLHPECFNADVTELLKHDPDPFGFATLEFSRTAEESKAINRSQQPCVVIAASGMMEAGRILHHLRHTIEDARNTILVMGFQAENTLGRRIVDREDDIKIMGERYSVRAQVRQLPGLSAHADHGELVAHISGCDRKRLKKIFLVHGEPDAAVALRSGLLDAGFADVEIPARFDRFTL
jgi:metallo-beta-lactamase family protein